MAPVSQMLQNGQWVPIHVATSKPGVMHCNLHGKDYLEKYGCLQCRGDTKTNPNAQVTETAQSQGVTLPGAYKMPDGTIYVVKFNRGKTRLYAKKLVDTPNRVTEAGRIVDFDFEYDPGAIFRLKPEYQLSEAEAKELMVKYGRCIICGRFLKQAKSVESGIGPVCAKYFKGRA